MTQNEPIRTQLVMRLTELRQALRTTQTGPRTPMAFMTLSEADAIVEALWRVDVGQYGTCSSCSRPIDASRLRAVMHAIDCARCEAAQSQTTHASL